MASSWAWVSRQTVYSVTSPVRVSVDSKTISTRRSDVFRLGIAAGRRVFLATAAPPSPLGHDQGDAAQRAAAGLAILGEPRATTGEAKIAALLVDEMAVAAKWDFSHG
jgi:hypothetical protein